MSSKRGIRFQVAKRIETNRQRAADVLEREQREQEAIRLLNQQDDAPRKNSIPQNSRY
jgi:hypothetical protein